MAATIVAPEHALEGLHRMIGLAFGEAGVVGLALSFRSFESIINDSELLCGLVFVLGASASGEAVRTSPEAVETKQVLARLDYAAQVVLFTSQSTCAGILKAASLHRLNALTTPFFAPEWPSNDVRDFEVNVPDIRISQLQKNNLTRLKANLEDRNCGGSAMVKVGRTVRETIGAMYSGIFLDNKEAVKALVTAAASLPNNVVVLFWDRATCVHCAKVMSAATDLRNHEVFVFIDGSNVKEMSENFRQCKDMALGCVCLKDLEAGLLPGLVQKLRRINRCVSLLVADALWNPDALDSFAQVFTDDLQLAAKLNFIGTVVVGDMGKLLLAHHRLSRTEGFAPLDMWQSTNRGGMPLAKLVNALVAFPDRKRRRQ